MKGPQDKSIIKQEVAAAKPLKVWGKGPIRLGGVELDCYGLEGQFEE